MKLKIEQYALAIGILSFLITLFFARGMYLQDDLLRNVWGIAFAISFGVHRGTYTYLKEKAGVRKIWSWQYAIGGAVLLPFLGLLQGTPLLGLQVAPAAFILGGWVIPGISIPRFRGRTLIIYFWAVSLAILVSVMVAAAFGLVSGSYWPLPLIAPFILSWLIEVGVQRVFHAA